MEARLHLATGDHVQRSSDTNERLRLGSDECPGRVRIRRPDFLRGCFPLQGCGTVISKGFAVILPDAASVLIEIPESELCVGQILICGSFVPVRGLPIILRDPDTIAIGVSRRPL